MGGSGGEKKQKKAKKKATAKKMTKAKTAKVDCDPASYLKVFVLRSDTKKGVEGIKVKAKATGGKSLPDKTTVKDTGLADFGKVDPKTYEVTVELTEEQKKKFKAPEKSNVAVPTGMKREHTVILEPIVELRVIVFGYDAEKKKDKAIEGRDWEYTTPVKKKGKTGSDGLIKVVVKQSDKKAKLTVKLKDPPSGTPGADPAVVNQPEDYPIKIKPDDWKDTDKKPVLPSRADDTVNWDLTLVDLKDTDNDDGIKGRLHNLAFPCDAGAEAAPTKLAVKAYQLLYENKRNGSGSLADVKADVKNRHDKA